DLAQPLPQGQQCRPLLEGDVIPQALDLPSVAALQGLPVAVRGQDLFDALERLGVRRIDVERAVVRIHGVGVVAELVMQDVARGDQRARARTPRPAPRGARGSPPRASIAWSW